jgi:Fic family protein
VTPDINTDDAIKVFEAFETGRLDQLFSETNTEYYDHEGFESLRIGVGVPREAVWRLISAIRRSTGLLVLESAWGDFQVRVTPTAQLMESLYDIDTWAARSLIGRTELPADEEWIVQDRMLVEEAVLVALAKAKAEVPTQAEIAETRSEVIAAIYDEVMPTSDAGVVAVRFYRTMRALPDARSQAISPQYIMDVHRLLRAGEPDAGILRTSNVAENEDGNSTATQSARIMGELQAMHAYTESQDVPFVHPLVKSLALAWWIRRVRPFEQYNYLVSRLVSMAFALRHGYRVSGIIESGLQLLDQPASGDDLTGRFIQQLKIISRSKDMGEAELRRRVTRFNSVTESFSHLGVNHRQALILDRALRAPETTFTIKHHARTRELAYETARQDFIRLVEAGYLEQQKRGKAFEFRLAQGAEKRLNKPK